MQFKPKSNKNTCDKVQKSIVWCKRSIADYIFILARTDCYTSVKKNAWYCQVKNNGKNNLFWDESLLICY